MTPGTDVAVYKDLKDVAEEVSFLHIEVAANLRAGDYLSDYSHRTEYKQLRAALESFLRSLPPA